MTNEPQDPSYNFERFTELEEASAHFGIVLRSLYDIYPEDVTLNQGGEQELVLVGRRSDHPAGARVAIRKYSNDILPTLTVTTNTPQGHTLHQQYHFKDLVYNRREFVTEHDTITGQEVPVALDADHLKSDDITAAELEGRLKFIGTLRPIRVLEEENDLKYRQSHGLKAFVRRYLLGKNPE